MKRRTSRGSRHEPFPALLAALAITVAALPSCELGAQAQPPTKQDPKPLPPEARPAQEAAMRTKLSVKLNLPYVSDKKPGRRKLDLYLPRDLVKPPLFVFIHGGAWITGDRSAYATLAKDFARQGLAVALISYRLAKGDDPAPHPASTLDGAAAIAWLRKKAPDFGYDPAKVFVGGHSAGAHMAGLLALDPQYLKAHGETLQAIRGAIGIEGIFDIPALNTRWPTYRAWFLEAAFGADQTKWADASPQSHSPEHRIPWLLIHSPKDELVEVEQSQRFAAHLEAGKSPVELFTRLESSHHGTVEAIGERRDPLAPLILRWITARCR